MQVQIFPGRADASQYGALPGNGGLSNAGELLSGLAVPERLWQFIYGDGWAPQLLQRGLYLRARQICAYEIAWECADVSGQLLRTAVFLSVCTVIFLGKRQFHFIYIKHKVVKA